MQYVDVIVGGQYGSEAKGHITAQIVAVNRRELNEAIAQDAVKAEDAEVWNVRVAGPNAGHTAYDADGNKFAFRTLPVGAVIPGVMLYIAPGSEIDLEVLWGEIALAEQYGHSVAGRLFISRQATVIEDRHKEQEAILVGKIGSTGKGIGSARADRLLRGAQTMGEYHAEENRLTAWNWAEPEDIYASDEIVHNKVQHIVIEGTQGYGLSLRASGHYPQVTSSDARSVDFLAMAGIDPTRCSVYVQNWIVARVYPIRVAGNSGPMKGETSWEALGLAEERTTVTQKVRRVGDWDLDLLQRAVQANGGHNARVIITMLDQVIPGLRDLEHSTLDGGADFDPEHPAILEAVDWIQTHTEDLGAEVVGFSFSPRDLVFNENALGRRRGNGTEMVIPESVLEAAVQQALGEIFGIESKRAGEDDN